MYEPVAAVIATLIDLQWNPKTPEVWVAPDGVEWYMDPTCHRSEVMTCFKRMVMQQHYSDAAKHFCGAGLQAGLDLQATFA